ncbi:MAG: [LysW]-lysine hydrolase [Acidobacteria bacterium]|nr:[LysW]-lysine hydrolase [Acidobacteriota bacterium]MDW7984338.1 [LysW]-lysine hydrolase [Acidobacteriota bacterium]
MTDSEALQLLESMLRIPSPSGQEAELADFLVRRMTDCGFRACIDEVGNAVGEVGEGPTTIVLLGHMDTVPGEIPVRYEGNCLYGRGAVDAKGPLAAFIAAAARLARRSDFLCRLVVIGCVEEEVPSSRGAFFVRDRYRPDFCVVGEPSGWDGLTIGYKGSLQVVIRIEGPASHSAHERVPVAEQACEAWVRIRSSAETFNVHRSRAFERLRPALTGLRSGGDGLMEWAELDIHLRLPPDLPPASAEAWLREQVGEGRVTVRGAVPAWVGSRTTPLHRAFARAIRRAGGTPRYLLKTGTSDLNVVAPAWQCPALAYGPGDAALDHTPEEHIVVPEFWRSLRVLEEALWEIGDVRRA